MNNEFLNKIVKVIVDRPLGSSHPRYKNTVYPVNYGFVPNTMANDGKEIDVYILRVNKPLKTFEGKVVAIIERLNDVENKLIVMPSDNCENVSKQEVVDATNFLEKYFKSRVIIN